MMMRMKRLFVLAALSAMVVTAGAQTATTFEMRYFTPDAAADGVTDFHGETEWFTTPQRVEMLGKYARYASRFWGDPGLDTPLFGESAVVPHQTAAAYLRPADHPAGAVAGGRL